MDVTPLIPAGQQVIQSYGANGFKISGQRYEGAVIVTLEKTLIWTEKTALSDITFKDFSPINELKDSLDIYLFGTGATSLFPDKSILKPLRESGVKPDIMDTGAACRTYNVLMAEGRRVAALLLPL